MANTNFAEATLTGARLASVDTAAMLNADLSDILTEAAKVEVSII
jgi:uncharacterized protein YjbI with pentapeptide repeats